MRVRILGYFPDPYSNLSVPGYPPVPVSFDALLRTWEGFLAGSWFAESIVLHLHVPFCARKCHYCDCSSDALRSRGDLAASREDVLRGIAELAPTFAGTTFRRLYVGGGTPDLLSAAMLSEVLDAVNHRSASLTARCDAWSLPRN